MIEAIKAANADPAWDLQVNGVSVLPNARELPQVADLTGRVWNVWESLTWVQHYCVRLRAIVDMSVPHLWHFWVWPVVGSTAMSESTFVRRSLKIAATKLPDPDLTLDFAGGSILHAQGLGVQSFVLDFDSGARERDGYILVPSRYAPSYPNQTGGNWPYMGITFPEDIDPQELYAIGCYGGWFQHPDGRLVTEEDYPKLVANSHIHEASKDRGWIHYTDPAAPWMDRMAGFDANQDHEHQCLFSPLAQQYALHPENQGYAMLCEAALHQAMRAIPVKDKGTYHHTSGQHRAQGRILKTFVDLYQTPMSQPLRLLAGRRAFDRWAIDRDSWIERWQKTDVPWVPFARVEPLGYSPAEIGIHYWGLWALWQQSKGIEGDFGRQLRYQMDAERRYQMDAIRRYCFESFVYFDLDGQRGWGVPWIRNPDGSPRGGPASAFHFPWLAASHYEPRNAAEKDKHDAILELGSSIAERFRW